MKKFTSLCSFPVIILSMFLLSCEDSVEVTRKYTIMEPVYLSKQEIRSSLTIDAPQPISTSGKIYMYQSYLFINEPGEGIHIIDNRNPGSPQQLSFITLPGNFNFAARGGYLYADSYMDLVVLDISNVQDVKVAGRNEDFFLNYNIQYPIHPDSGVVVDYAPREIIEVSNEDEFYYNHGRMVDYVFFNDDLPGARTLAVAESASFSEVPTGIGGSMARFTITKDHLYIIDQSQLYSLKLDDPTSPERVADLYVNWDIETLFPYKDQLFIGAQSGMHIIDNSNPASPKHISTFTHIQSCDPVVVQDDRAYVTLKSGTFCGNVFEDRLEVINIEDLHNPVLMTTYTMDEPNGLGIDDDILFVCDGQSGLKVYNAADDYKISDHQIAHADSIHAYDVIPYYGLLFLIGEDGLYQYDYSEPENIKLLSRIAIDREVDKSQR